MFGSRIQIERDPFAGGGALQSSARGRRRACGSFERPRRPPPSSGGCTRVPCRHRIRISVPFGNREYWRGPVHSPSGRAPAFAGVSCSPFWAGQRVWWVQSASASHWSGRWDVVDQVAAHHDEAEAPRVGGLDRCPEPLQLRREVGHAVRNLWLEARRQKGSSTPLRVAGSRSLSRHPFPATSSRATLVPTISPATRSSISPPTNRGLAWTPSKTKSPSSPALPVAWAVPSPNASLRKG